MPGILYVVSTPIGNLEDVTLRALRILREVDLIAAEDTRVTRKLLSHFDIHTSLTSFHQHTRGEKAESLVARLVSGQSIAVVSDAGTPAVSDPGAELVHAALNSGIAVVPIPGCSAVLSALVVSDLPAGRFCFEGFPPRTKTDRREFFESLAREQRTIVLYESPQRLSGTLDDLFRALGERTVAIARELTKLHEEVYRGNLSGAIAYYESNKPRGEFTLVIGGAPVTSDEAEPVDSAAIERALQAEIDVGATPRDAIRHVAARFQLSRRLVYRIMNERKADSSLRSE